MKSSNRDQAPPTRLTLTALISEQSSLPFLSAIKLQIAALLIAVGDVVVASVIAAKGLRAVWAVEVPNSG